MTQANVRERSVGEQNRHTPRWAIPVNDHVGVRHAPDERLCPKRGEWVTRQRAVTDRLDGEVIKTGPATMVKDFAGFRVSALSQAAGLSGALLYPALTESGLDRRPLLFKLRIVGALGCHG
jgi:hypothetical protein